MVMEGAVVLFGESLAVDRSSSSNSTRSSTVGGTVNSTIRRSEAYFSDDESSGVSEGGTPKSMNSDSASGSSSSQVRAIFVRGWGPMNQTEYARVHLI